MSIIYNFIKKKIITKKNVLFLFFFILSSILWLLNVLDKKYTTKIEYPIFYKNIPQNKILSKKLPKKIELELESVGFNLLKYKIGNTIKPINLDISLIFLKKKMQKNDKNFFLTKKELLENIKKQLEENFFLKNINIDTLFFNFSSIIKKKFFVKHNVEVNLKKQYMLKEEIFTLPDSVTLSATASILDTIKFVETVERTYNNLSKNIQMSIKLKILKDIKYSQNSVNLNIPVEKFTEATVKIPVEIINIPKKENIKIFPNTIRITYLIGLSNYKKLDKNDFRAIVDYNSIFDKNHKIVKSKMKVQIINYPKYLLSFKCYPKKLEYIISY